MTTIANTINELNQVFKAQHGSDIYITVSRCPAFGNEDCCVAVGGKKHALAAADLAKVMAKNGATIKTVSSTRFPDQKPYTYSVVTWTP